MKKVSTRWLSGLFLTALIFSTTVAMAQPQSFQSLAADGSQISHVLLISVDGLHMVDVMRYISAHPNSAMAQLYNSGVTYSNAATAKPSDSFPGILAITTGGTPNSTGVWYDDSYDRLLSEPGSDCSVKGTEVVYDESIDKNPDALDGGGGIDESMLPRDGSKGCVPVYPHSFLRVNTIFEVIKASGKRTAWSDKHPSYDLLNGPSGKGVDDLYTPEIAGGGTTTSVAKTEAYDDIKVKAILNELDGLDHTGASQVGVPAILGMNFQAVSVAQKLKGVGYTDVFATPSDGLQDALSHTDASLGQMVAKLKANNLLSSTLVVLTAKHGQSPIDPSKRTAISGKVIPSIINQVKPGLVAQATQDDVALIWLTDQSQTSAAVYQLGFPANQQAAGIQTILSEDSLVRMFPNPLTDSRVPDIIALPNKGVIYTGGSKIAEHGGFSDDDNNVPIIMSNPAFGQKLVKLSVQTTQIAPTILKYLGLDPNALQAVQIEGTPMLPGLGN